MNGDTRVISIFNAAEVIDLESEDAKHHIVSHGKPMTGVERSTVRRRPKQNRVDIERFALREQRGEQQCAHAVPAVFGKNEHVRDIGVKFPLDNWVGKLFDNLQPDCSDCRTSVFGDPGAPVRIIVEMRLHPNRAARHELGLRFDRGGQRGTKREPQASESARVWRFGSANARLRVRLHRRVSIEGARFAQRCGRAADRAA